MYGVSWNMICASVVFGMLSSFSFVLNNLFSLFSNVNKNCVSILCGKFTRPKDVKNPSRILQYIFLPNNVRKSVTLSPKFASVLSADVFDVFDLLFLPLFKMTGFFSWSNLSLILSRDFFGRCLNCWAAYW